MASKAQKIRLVIFFLTAISAFTLIFVTIIGESLLSERDVYTVEFSDSPVSGLNRGSIVKYLGFKIGRVEDIFISPKDVNTVVITISVEPRSAENALRIDTKARMASLGITGLKYVELYGGSNNAKVLTPGSRIQSGETFFGNLQERAEALSVKIENAVDNLNILLSEPNRKAFSLLLMNSSALATTAEDIFNKNGNAITATASNLATASDNLAKSSAIMNSTMDSLNIFLTGQTLRNTIDDLSFTISNLRSQMDGPIPNLIARMDTMVGNADRTFVGIDQTVGASRQNLLRAMQDLEETLQNVRETTELVRENPAILIRGGGRSNVAE